MDDVGVVVSSRLSSSEGNDGDCGNDRLAGLLVDFWPSIHSRRSLRSPNLKPSSLRSASFRQTKDFIVIPSARNQISSKLF